MIGFHFRFQLRVDWPGLAHVFDERARLLGCPPPGDSLRPRAGRVTVSGTVDQRLREGGLRYEFVLYTLDGVVVDVQLGRTGEPLGIRFGVDPRTQGEWCSNDTLNFSSAGLFIPEQRTADQTRGLPACSLRGSISGGRCRRSRRLRPVRRSRTPRNFRLRLAGRSSARPVGTSSSWDTRSPACRSRSRR